MRAERRARVELVGDSTVRLRLAPRCSDCSGCAGRCHWFAGDAGLLDLPLAQFDATPLAAQGVRLYLPSEVLLAQAWRGYGWPACGLLGGALLGHAMAPMLNLGSDAAAVLLAAVGTYAGISASKRSKPLPCRASPADSDGGDEPVFRIEPNEDTQP